MDGANDQHERADDSKIERACHQCDDKKIPWRLVSFIAIAALVLLVGLPIGAVLIVNLSGCCFANSPENVITFWASMIAGFLTLFGMVVTGVFVLVAFKTKEIAKAEAQSEANETARSVAVFEARKAAETFIRSRRGELFEALEQAKDDVADAATNVKRFGEEVVTIRADATALHSEATEEIAAARDQTLNTAREAQADIGGAQDQTTTVAREAQVAIGGARDQTTNVAGEAQAAIGEARGQTTSAANEAQEAIGRAQEEAEAAARTVRELADRAAGGTAQEGTPGQQDE